MRWSYRGEQGWQHLDKLPFPLPQLFKKLPISLRPCPMSVDLIRVMGQMGFLFTASSGLMWMTRRRQ